MIVLASIAVAVLVALLVIGVLELNRMRDQLSDLQTSVADLHETPHRAETGR